MQYVYRQMPVKLGWHCLLKLTKRRTFLWSHRHSHFFIFSYALHCGTSVNTSLHKSQVFLVHILAPLNVVNFVTFSVNALHAQSLTLLCSTELRHSCNGCPCNVAFLFFFFTEKVFKYYTYTHLHS